MTDPMKLSARAGVPLADVRRALTDPVALRTWLAEHAEVALPSRYEFWGRYTPDGDAPHQTLQHVDDTSLRFTWLLDGEETTTEITLEPDGDATVINLAQTGFDFQSATSGEPGSRNLLLTFWSLAIANLVDHLEGRELTGMCDLTDPELRGEYVIAASREEVYDSLVDPTKMSAWFGYPIGIEAWVGGRFAMGGLDADPEPAKVIDLEPGRRMSTDWGAAGVVTWELADSGGKTRLTFVQSGFGSNVPYSGWLGWLSGLAELRRFHELPDWTPIWINAEYSGTA